MTTPRQANKCLNTKLEIIPGSLIGLINDRDWHDDVLEETFIVGNIDASKCGFEVSIDSLALVLDVDLISEKLTILVDSKVGWIWLNDARMILAHLPN